MNYQDFTIIIPEHNRPDHLRRLLDYYLSKKVKVIVSDSSKYKFKYLNLYEDKIIYKYYPAVDLAKKIVNVFEYITTPYVVMCANDDFIIPHAIEKITVFLNENLDYNSGQGYYYDFTPNKLNTINYRYPQLRNGVNNSPNPKIRYFKLMKAYYQYYYAVYRTDIFKETYKSVLINGKSKIKNLCLLEIYTAIYPCIKGKHYILKDFYALRENDSFSIAHFVDNYIQLINNEKEQTEINFFKKQLSILLSDIKYIDYLQSYSIIEEGLNLYEKQIRICKLNIIIKYFLKIVLKSNLWKDKELRHVIKYENSKKELKNIMSFIKKYYAECYILK